MNCQSRQQVSGLRDPAFARQWLRQFQGDSAGLSFLRKFLPPEDRILVRTSDDEVLNRLSKLLASGGLHVHALAGPAAGGASGGGAGGATAEASVPFPLADRRKWAPESKQAQAADPATFPDDLDGQQQTAALMSAAAQGVPFCAE